MKDTLFNPIRGKWPDPMISHIHHINFLVRNLNTAVERYEQMLGLEGFIFDSLEGRAVKTARIKLGDTWLVLVEPIDAQGVPAQHLERYGEGFFLISLGTDNLDAHIRKLDDLGCDASQCEKRQGLDNWSVADLPFEQFFGAQFQLTEENNTSFK